MFLIFFGTQKQERCFFITESCRLKGKKQKKGVL